MRHGNIEELKLKKIALYAINMFFVEVKYNNEKKIIIDKKAFVAGIILSFFCFHLYLICTLPHINPCSR
jgi:hypothetical protein